MIKGKAIVNCTGDGYKNFKIGEIRDIPKKLADILIKFGYVEKVKEPSIATEDVTKK